MHRSCWKLAVLVMAPILSQGVGPRLLASSGNGCSALKGRVVAAAEIGLPTNGAVVNSAKHATSHGVAFCKAVGEIRSIDAAAQPIRFQVNLPEQWNGHAVQVGGAVFDGSLKYSSGTRGPEMAVKGAPTPLKQGYATFGSDAGHHHRYFLFPDETNVLRADFAQNTEQRQNFASGQIKKTHDVAIALIRARYGSGPKRMFFLGGSTGGREALQAIQKWPRDYNGVLAAFAAWNQIESDLGFIRAAQALYAKDGWLPKSRTKLLHDAVLNACDAQDGLKDGIVSSVSACRFDAQTLRCADGHNHAGCLSDGQLHTVMTFATEQKSSLPVANGMAQQPGYNILSGGDLTGNLGLLKHPMKRPVFFLNSFYYLVGTEVVRNFLTKDNHFDALTFDTASLGKWRAGVLEQSLEDDASIADLTPYEQQGGKLLLVHGDADVTIPTESSVLYYKRLVEAMGQARADGFTRLYLIPGYGHGRGVFNAGFNALGTLEAWADGHAPATLITTDRNSGRTRPMCVWPEWPRYIKGDINAASSFECVRETTSTASLE